MNDSVVPELELFRFRYQYRKYYRYGRKCRHQYRRVLKSSRNRYIYMLALAKATHLSSLLPALLSAAAGLDRRRRSDNEEWEGASFAVWHYFTLDSPTCKTATCNVCKEAVSRGGTSVVRVAAL
ncbi:uncharacterized protein V6R79_015648 [Siganus canaliculatus]